MSDTSGPKHQRLRRPRSLVGTPRRRLRPRQPAVPRLLLPPPPTSMREEHGPPMLELARRMTVCSCRHDPRPAPLVLTTVPAQSIPLANILADSGCAHRAAWAIPLCAAGAQVAEARIRSTAVPTTAHERTFAEIVASRVAARLSSPLRSLPEEPSRDVITHAVPIQTVLEAEARRPNKEPSKGQVAIIVVVTCSFSVADQPEISHYHVRRCCERRSPGGSNPARRVPKNTKRAKQRANAVRLRSTPAVGQRQFPQAEGSSRDPGRRRNTQKIWFASEDQEFESPSLTDQRRVLFM